MPPTCEYERLYAAYVFTDDPVFVVVGAERTVRALRTWRRLTADSGLIMAIPEKRHLGSHAMWLRVSVIVALGIVVVPTAKLLHAARVIKVTLAEGVEFSLYRSRARNPLSPVCRTCRRMSGDVGECRGMSACRMT